MAVPPNARADHPSRGAIANLEIHEAWLRGALPEAEAAVARANTIFGGGARDKSLGLFRTRLTQCDMALSQGRTGAALAHAQEALALAGGLSEGFEKTAYLGTAWLQLALVHERIGARDETHAAASRAFEHLQFSLGELSPKTRQALALRR
jgi:hypothetical protein